MKQAHQTFLIEMMKHGDKTRAYQKAYPNCTDAESARKSAERLLRNHPAIAAEIEEAAYSIQQRAYAEAYRLHAEERKTAILSMMDKRVILARIAKCEIKVCRYIKDGDRYRMLFEDPHPREIIRAIDADGRIEDRLNRARNLSDPKLSQFYIYIDGRPCDDPTAPINDKLPPGIVMLPRRTKKLMEEHGNNLEHFHTHNVHHTSPPEEVPIAIGIGVPPAPEKDLMSASFYEQEQQAEAAALPPHILTDEEVRQLHAEADRKLEEKKKQPQQPYNTFGKMYFPPEGRNPAK